MAYPQFCHRIILNGNVPTEKRINWRKPVLNFKSYKKCGGIERMKIVNSIEIDVLMITSELALYDHLHAELGFPSFFGNNPNALIDCLFSLRFPADQMTKYQLKDDEYIVFILKNSHSSDLIIRNFLFNVLATVSLKLQQKSKNSAVMVLFHS